MTTSIDLSGINEVMDVFIQIMPTFLYVSIFAALFKMFSGLTKSFEF